MDTNQLAAQTALRSMFYQGHFSICTIDKILAALNRIAEPKAYKTLSLLHCINYCDMPPELREKLPELIKAVLGDGGFNIDAMARQHFANLCSMESESCGERTVSETHITFIPPRSEQRRGFLTRMFGA